MNKVISENADMLFALAKTSREHPEARERILRLPLLRCDILFSLLAHVCPLHSHVVDAIDAQYCKTGDAVWALDAIQRFLPQDNMEECMETILRMYLGLMRECYARGDVNVAAHISTST